MSRVPVYPVAFVAAHILNQIADSAAPAWAGVRPLLVVVGLTVLLLLALVRPLGRHRAGYAAAVIASFLTGVVLVTLVLLIGALYVVARRITRDRWPAPAPARITYSLNVIGLVLLSLAAVNVVTSGAMIWPRPPDVRAQPHAGDPNIYFFMLDGHPRGDTLASYGYDDTGFVDVLASMGFEVAPHSHSNYTKTWLTLATTAQAAHADQLPDAPSPNSGVGEQERALSSLFNTGPVWTALRERGYEIVTSGTVFSELTLQTADRALGSPRMTSLEGNLLRLSPLTRLGRLVPMFAADVHRSYVREQLRMPVELPEADMPMFVWTHVISPHAPIVFASDGAPLDPACYPTTCSFFAPWAADSGLSDAAFAKAMANQTAYIDQLLAANLRDLIARDPDAVVVLMSDHGDRHAAQSDEWFHNFLAVRAPGHAGLFPPDAAAITILPTLVNTYADADLDVPDPERTYMSVGDRPLTLIAWPLDEAMSSR